MNKYLSILLALAFAATASAQTFRASAAPKKTKPVATPPPISKGEVQGAVPRAFRGGNPLQMFNPKAPARYGTWVESTSFDPDIPGKWKGIKLFEIVF